MKPRHSVLFAAILVLPVAAGGDRNQTASPSTPAPAFSQGMILTIDASGKFVPGAQTTELQAGLGEALSTSSEGLVEKNSPVAGGGVMVNLEGRFQNAMVIEKDANGEFTAPCVAGTPAETAAKEVE